jgi:hypothetical protein
MHCEQEGLVSSHYVPKKKKIGLAILLYLAKWEGCVHSKHHHYLYSSGPASPTAFTETAVEHHDFFFFFYDDLLPVDVLMAFSP